MPTVSPEAVSTYIFLASAKRGDLEEMADVRRMARSLPLSLQKRLVKEHPFFRYVLCVRKKKKRA